MVNFNPGEHVCLVGSAQPTQHNPIYLANKMLLLVLVVERETGRVIDCDINTVCDVTKQFIRSIFLGKNLVEDIEELRTSILNNYMGGSAKAMVTATRAARMQYLDCVQR